MSSLDTTRAPRVTATPSLWEKHVKIQPKSVRGRFRRLKWIVGLALLAIYVVLPWLRWDRGPGVPDQAVLFDFAGSRFYLFTLEIWPQQIYFLTGFLIFCAVALFLGTALYGRLWCGYACPQTVWTDVFMWVERLVDGDRSDRIRRDNSAWSGAKLVRTLIRHSVWLLIALVTGGTGIGYFVDAPTLARDLVGGQASAEATFFVALFTATTYLLAGFAREQVCFHMCPWPRFQASMQDEDSLTVTYRDWRGEGRAPVRRGVGWDERKSRGLGDCIDCRACVQVCPTGIDIRDGQQLQCIGCALCADACNGIMARLGRPGDLIAFDTLAHQRAGATGQPAPIRLVRPRTVVYGLILLITAGAMVTGLVLRPRLDVSVLRDRAPLFVTLADGGIRNGYTVKISNMTPSEQRYRLTLDGLPQATFRIGGQGDPEREMSEARLTAPPAAVATWRVFVRMPPNTLSRPSTPLGFILTAETDGAGVSYDSTFLGP